jgi:ABC-type maltose transport system permease subunit
MKSMIKELSLIQKLLWAVLLCWVIQLIIIVWLSLEVNSILSSASYLLDRADIYKDLIQNATVQQDTEWLRNTTKL